MDLSIADIKKKVTDNDYLISVNSVDGDGIKKVLTLYQDLQSANISSKGLINQMKNKKAKIILILSSLILLVCAGFILLYTRHIHYGIESHTSYNAEIPVATYEYDIEEIFTDPLFRQIMEGEVMPVEVVHGFGGEGGYDQYSTTDPKVILEYIEAFKELHITDIITDEAQMVFVADAIDDYIFRLEDGREVLISMELNSYVLIHDENPNAERFNTKEYVLEFSQRLYDLNEQINNTAN